MSIVNILMNKQITCLPHVLEKYASKYYNNALGNTLFWCFFIWFTIHVVFDKSINAVLRRMKYPEYVRCRIVSTLWSFGFSLVSFVYSYATLAVNDIEVFNRKYILQEKDVPSQFVLGFVILYSYFAQSACWEASHNGVSSIMLDCTLMTCCTLLIYYAGCIEILFALVCIVGVAECFLEISRTFAFQTPSNSFSRAASYSCFIIHLLLSILTFLVIPIQFLLPMIRGAVFGPSFLLALLSISLLAWFTLHIYNSAIFKAAKHYLWHSVDEKSDCEISLIECSMFPPRDDTAYNVYMIRRKIEEDKIKLTTRRKKPEAALFQTVKCMLAVRRKLKQRRECNLSENTKFCRDILDEIVTNVTGADDEDGYET